VVDTGEGRVVVEDEQQADGRQEEEVRDATAPDLAAEAAPASEREGTVAVDCSGAVWAQELTLLEGDLRGRLNGRLNGRLGGVPVRSLRFRVKTP